MRTKKFASHAELAQEKVGFEKRGVHVYTRTAENDPNPYMAVGGDVMIVIDRQRR